MLSCLRPWCVWTFKKSSTQLFIVRALGHYKVKPKDDENLEQVQYAYNIDKLLLIGVGLPLRCRASPKVFPLKLKFKNSA